jgi:RNA polymerase sigma-70 factor, ECF subfamily
MVEPGLDVEALYRRYGPMVVRRCRYLLRSPEEADDVAQEVFVRLLRQRERLTDAHPSSLLYRMATNLSLNRIRDRKRQADPVPETAEAFLSRVAALDRLDAPLVLERLFGRQPESTRTMAVLHHVDGLSLEEVARECRMSVSGVRRRLRLLREALRGSGTALPEDGGRA